MDVVAIDYECEYGRELSVQRQGNMVYASLTNIFLVSFWSPDLQYVGSLSEAPWEKIDGLTWVSHNAGFDEAAFRACRQRGLVPAIAPAKWNCSADLSAFVGVGRKLSEAVLNSFGVEISKSIRQRAGNRVWPDGFNEKMRKDFHEYCLADSRWCYELWAKWHHLWLPEEQDFAQIIRKRSLEGIAIDQEKLAQVKSVLQFRVREAREQLPWPDPPLSRVKLVAWCEEQGIEPPKSTAEKSPELPKWIEKYGAEYPQVFWVGRYRKANRRLAVCEAIERRIMSNGRAGFNLKYHGAGNTGRLSGSDGLNMQNLNKDSDGGVDLRSVFVAAPGKTLIIADFAQIEPRVSALICQDKKLLDQLAGGMNYYEVDARLAGVWNGEPGTLKKSDPKLYQLQKAQTLGIGYGMGPKRFTEAARSMLSLEFSLLEAQTIIGRWHVRYPGVRKVHTQLERAMTRALSLNESFGIQLPSGRWLRYYDLKREDGKITAATTKGSKRRMYYWGGVLFENVVQAVARDVLRDAILRLESAGYPVIFSSHDEIISEVDPSVSAEEVIKIMCIPPIWAPNLPLSAEAVASAHYLK